MNTVEVVTAIIAALGGAAIIPKIVDGIKAMRDHRARDEKDENRTLLGRAATAERRADREAEYRRRIEVWAGDKIPSKPVWARSKENA